MQNFSSHRELAARARPQYLRNSTHSRSSTINRYSRIPALGVSRSIFLTKGCRRFYPQIGSPGGPEIQELEDLSSANACARARVLPATGLNPNELRSAGSFALAAVLPVSPNRKKFTIFILILTATAPPAPGARRSAASNGLSIAWSASRPRRFAKGACADSTSRRDRETGPD